jgi:hypothetical protein
MPIGVASPICPTGMVTLNADTISSSIRLVGSGESVVPRNLTASPAHGRSRNSPVASESRTNVPMQPGSRVVPLVKSLIAYATAMLARTSGSVLYKRGDGAVL